MDIGWHDLPPGSFGADASVPGVDPLFVWADGTGFRDFFRDRQPHDAVPVLCELAKGVSISDFATELEKRDGRMPDAYRHASPTTRYCTATFNAECFRALAQFLRRCEIQLPVIPLRPARRDGTTAKTVGEGIEAVGKTLVGIIDSGCPFAHANFRRDGKTRLLAIWDQDPAPHYVDVDGRRPAHFGYGAELLRDDIDRLTARYTRAGVVDEDACYRAAGHAVPMPRMSHGAAVLDLLVGPRPRASRMSDDPDHPPTWEKFDDGARTADLVFVDLPRDGVQDSSSGGLGRSILDGLRYICGRAGPDTRRIVVNISNGTSRSTHDGTSIIERAMAALVEEQAQHFGRELRIVIAAGNDRDEERHARVDIVNAGETRLNLRVPPGSEAPTWVTVRIPAAARDFLKLTLRPPGGRDGKAAGRACAVALFDADAPGAVAGIVHPEPLADADAGTALIVIACTERSEPGARASDGDWEIVLAASRPIAEPVHLHISRNQQNPGALRRGRQARFVTRFEQYDPMRWRRKAEVDPVPAESPVRRASTLNGLATYPPGQGLVVVTGIESRRTPDGPRQPVYASLGPSAGPAREPSRESADDEAVTDAYRGLRGIVVAGSRSGSHARVLGTSFAAPQVARRIADGKKEQQPRARRRGK
jgi:hypothetical protein